MERAQEDFIVRQEELKQLMGQLDSLDNGVTQVIKTAERYLDAAREKINLFLEANELESTQEPQEMSEGFLSVDRSNYDKFSKRVRQDLKKKKLGVLAEFEKKQRLEKEKLMK